MFTKGSFIAAPGYPLEKIVDPTGCGDCFAGALVGYLAKKGKVTEKEIRRAMIFASATASINAEGFSLENLKNATLKSITARAKEFREFVKF
jgi:ribokinase